MSGTPFTSDDKPATPLRDIIWGEILHRQRYPEEASLMRVWVVTAGVIAIIAASILVSAIVLMLIVKFGQVLGFW